MSKNALGFCYESSTTFSDREFVAKVWNCSKLLPTHELQELTTDYTIQLRSLRSDYVSASNPKHCQFVELLMPQFHTGHESPEPSRIDKC